MIGEIKLGPITVDRIVEQQAPFFTPLEFFPSLSKEVLEENRSWMEPSFLDPATGKLVLAIQSYVVRTPHHNILVDSCCGNHKPRPARPMWNMLNTNRFEKGLAATGLTVNDIDFVMCTHLHIDHVGWNTRLENGRWVPTFPKARYIFSDKELAFWTKRQKEEPDVCPWITDSVLPIVAANRVDVVKSDHQFDDHVSFIQSPGHSPDHFCVHVGKLGQDAMIAGDMIHSPLQARYPELGMRADFDSKQAGETRRKLFSQFCDTSTLWCTSRFPVPSTGRVTRWGDGFKFADA